MREQVSVDFDRLRINVLLRKVIIVCDGDLAIRQNNAIRNLITIGDLMDFREEAVSIGRQREAKK